MPVPNRTCDGVRSTAKSDMALQEQGHQTLERSRALDRDGVAAAAEGVQARVAQARKQRQGALTQRDDPVAIAVDEQNRRRDGPQLLPLERDVVEPPLTGRREERRVGGASSRLERRAQPRIDGVVAHHRLLVAQQLEEPASALASDPHAPHAVVPGPEPCSSSTAGPDPTSWKRTGKPPSRTSSASAAADPDDEATATRLLDQAGTVSRSRTPMNARDHSGRSGQPRQDTMLPSTTSGPSTTVAPAFSMSPVSGGHRRAVGPGRRPRHAGGLGARAF